MENQIEEIDDSQEMASILTPELIKEVLGVGKEIYKMHLESQIERKDKDMELDRLKIENQHKEVNRFRDNEAIYLEKSHKKSIITFRYSVLIVVLSIIAIVILADKEVGTNVIPVLALVIGNFMNNARASQGLSGRNQSEGNKVD